MAPAGDVAERLPSKEKLREALKPETTTDPRVIDKFLQPVQRQAQARDNRLRILLQACAEAGNERLVEALLCRKANVDAVTQTSLAPLISAARQGNVAIIAMLLHWNANIEIADRSGKTALMHAAMSSKAEAAKLLLAKGAQVDVLDKERRNALIYAASSDKIEVLQMLLDKGANVGARDRHGSNAVTHAAANGNAEALLLLLDKSADFNNIDDQRMTPAIHAASRGHVDALRVLLHYGADCTKSDAIGKTAIFHAAENNDPKVLELLLNYQADFRGVDMLKRSALLTAILSEKKDQNNKLKTVTMLLEAGVDLRENAESLKCLSTAALRGFNDVLRVLIKHKANVNAMDDKGRTALLSLASDPTRVTKWNAETVKILLDAQANLFKADLDRKRTALQWAAATGQYVFAQTLLNYVKEGDLYSYVNRSSSRYKTALHLAAQHDYSNIIRLLLNNQAEIDCRSEGDWTPFLIAAKAGHDSVVETLLAAAVPADVNARTSSGMTALHWAAENGHTSVVRRILNENKAWKNPKDSFDTTPLSRADRNRESRKEIIELLRDHIFRPPPPDHAGVSHAEDACDMFTASVVDFFPIPGDKFRSDVRRIKVRQVLYDRDLDQSKFAITTKLEDIKKGSPSFRWVHLPANNLAWAEVLITKMIVEGGPIDNAGFQSMLRIFGQQQHRGTKAHSRFMRPLCQVHGSDDPFRRTPRFNLSKPPSYPSRTSTSTLEESSPTLNRKLSVPEPITASPSPSRQNSAPQLATAPVPKDIGVVFMPYLHWETNSNRQKMRDVVRHVMDGGITNAKHILTKDECLIRGYLRHSTDLHLRRTLDQFRHHNINTDKRDKDQVVYRHHITGKTKKDPKIFMVDQMWIWIFQGMIITCFPERWGQPIRDPLNVFDGVVEDINSNILPPVRSIYDLAAAITNRCTGSFDRHEWGYEDIDFMFFEIFELSIGTLTRRATALLERFELDSTAAAKWLKSRDDSVHLPRQSTEKEDDRENDEDEWLKDSDDESSTRRQDNNPVFVNRLLNISKETKLLVECKDIEDELAILSTVLDQQLDVLKTMIDVLKVPRKRVGLQVRLVGQHLLDIQRMLKSANGVSKSLTQLLDLKQKHANAIEARFARDQAEDTARQGQTIMVFTIVTIVFLPLSFMASFFAINILEFPHNAANGGSGLHLGWVSKYLFGIGFTVSVPLIAVAFVFADARGSRWQLKQLFQFRSQTARRPNTIKPVQTPMAQQQVHQSRPTAKDLDDAEARAAARDSEGYVFPRRNTTRVETGLTAETMDSEV